MMRLVRWRTPLFFACAVLLALAAHAASADWERPPVTARELAQGFRDDVVIAQPLASRRANAEVEETAEGRAPRRILKEFGDMRALPVLPGETAPDAVERLRATGRYEFVEVDRLRHPAALPNDPDFPQQWALVNTGDNSPLTGPGIVGADIHAASAWDIRHDAPGVIVGIADTGALLTHADLIDNLWNNPTAGKDGYVGDAHGIDATSSASSSAGGNPTDTDSAGHGTHVAGIIGATGNNNSLVSGVAWKVQLMPLKFIGPNGGSSLDEVTCLAFAQAHGAKVINASFGQGLPSAAEYQAIQKLGQNGIILVCAAGNAGTDTGLSGMYPSDYPLDNIVSVAASDNRDDLVYFSSYGSGLVELAAPGENILSLNNASTTATRLLSGTSMATPMVTGALALLKAQFPNDSYRQSINRLLRHVDLNRNFTGRVQSGGRLNLAAALASDPGDNTPCNDSFAQRARLSGATVVVRSSNVGATREPGEPGSAYSTLWWEWTAPASGAVSLSTTIKSGLGTTGSAYPPQLDVYTGSSLGALSPVASASGAPLTFTAQAGTTYEICIGSVNGVTGLTVFTLAYANDNFASALTLPAPSGAVTGTTLNATVEGGEPHLANHSAANSVWYQWTAPRSGHFVAVVSSPDFDPLLGVYTGSSVSGLTAVGSAAGATINSSALGPFSNATAGFVATAGVTYHICVDGAVDSGTGQGSGQFTLAVNDARWVASATDELRTSPTVAPDGSIYIAGEDGVVYAYRPDGTTRWTFTAGGAFDSSALSLAADGTIYGGAEDGNVYALTPAGALKWKFAVDHAGSNPGVVSSTPAVGPDGTIYVKDSATTLYALTPAGTLKWRASVPGGSYAAPVIGTDGAVYVGCDDNQGGGKLFAFNPDGTGRWIYDAGQAITTAAAIDATGHLYFATLGGKVIALDAGGNLLWEYAAGNSISSSPALGANGMLLFGCYDRQLYALDAATGALRWRAPLGGEVRASSPAVDANGVAYVGCYDGLVYAINPDGTLKRTYATAGLVRSSPAIAGTTLYVGSADFRLYAFDLGASAGATAWPMYMGAAQRDGRVANDPLAIVTAPTASVGLTPGASLSLTVAATGAGPLQYQWYRQGQAITGANDSTYYVPSPTGADYGIYTVTVTGPQGAITSLPAVVGGASAPLITAQPQSATVPAGANVTLFANIAGGSLTYQWSFAGAPLPGATGAALSLPNIGAHQGANYGSYTLTATNALGSVTTTPATVTVQTSAQLLNLSARAAVAPGDINSLTAGFVLSAPKRVLVRGIGPTLAGYNIPNALSSPTLRLFNSAQTQIDQNAGWSGGGASATAALQAAFSQVGAFSLPVGSGDAALLENLPPASGVPLYTAEVDAGSGPPGVALAEVYDADSSSPARLINLSARAVVGSGTNALVAGFVIAGSTSETLLLRGVGPTLASAPFSLAGTLAQPALILYDAASHPLASNTGWQNNASVATAASHLGAFALIPGGSDAALLVTLAPGLYTAQLSGADGGGGLALIEVYEVR